MENQNNFHMQKLNEQETFWRERLNKELVNNNILIFRIIKNKYYNKNFNLKKRH